MRRALVIASRDLRSYLTTFRGYAVFFFFLGILGIFFHSFVRTFVEMQEKNPELGGAPPSVDQLVTAICHNLNFILLMALPALTMNSFAGDRRKGVYKLLQSVHLAPAEIVFGKYLSLLCLITLVLLSSSVYFIYIFAYGQPDLGQMVASYFGFFLQISAQVAFGVWVSVMSRSPLMAFLFTSVGLFFFFILDWIAPTLSVAPALEQFLSYLSSVSHLKHFFEGSISISDVAYFCLTTMLFLFLATLVVDIEKWR